MTRLAYRLKSAGQLLIIGFDGRQMTPGLRALLDWVQPAGVILFARNIQSAEQTWQLLRECQRCVATPLFTCIDLEGGSVDRLRDLMGPTPAATDVFATGDRSMFRKHGELIAANCRALGFNVDFAPVLDLAFPASLKVMGSRTVSADPRKTTTYAREFLQGFDNGGVLGCGKHFPGLGEGRLDSHHKLPVIEKPLRKLWNEDLLPYRNLRRRLPFVMVSHAAYPKVSGQKVPATLSKSWISGILRRRIGYRNLIVSDDLEMGGLLSAASVGEAAIEFVRAGGDLCLVCHREDRVLEACETLTKTIERDKKFARRAAESQRRLLAFKKKHAKQLRGVRRPSATTIEKLRRKLWEFGEQVRLENLEHPESAAHE